MFITTLVACSWVRCSMEPTASTYCSAALPKYCRLSEHNARCSSWLNSTEGCRSCTPMVTLGSCAKCGAHSCRIFLGTAPRAEIVRFRLGKTLRTSLTKNLKMAASSWNETWSLRTSTRRNCWLNGWNSLLSKKQQSLYMSVHSLVKSEHVSNCG